MKQGPKGPCLGGDVAFIHCLFCFRVEAINYTSRSGSYQADKVIEGLSSPWAMAFSPTGLLFITEKTGDIKVFKNNEFVTKLTGLPEDIAFVGQGGLLDIAFHPEYPKKAFIYLSYTTRSNVELSGGISTRISRFKVLNNRSLVEEKILLQGGYGTDGAHFGGALAFDQSGYLFVTIGERHHKEKAQDLSFLNGKVLRLHDDGRIPIDNPFVNVEGARKEIYTFGHRNPQGLAIHPITNTPYISEHGPSGYDANLPAIGRVGKADEVNILSAAQNYGWPLLFGDPEILPWTQEMLEFSKRENVRSPLIEFTKPDGIAPAGSSFYTGDKFPSWKNDFFVTALRGYIIRLKVSEIGEVIESEKIIPRGFSRLRDTVTAPNGNILAIAKDDIIEIKPGVGNGSVSNPSDSTNSKNIMTIFERYNCLNCHGSSITSKGKVPSSWVSGGVAEETQLYRYLLSGRMPIGGDRLTPEDLSFVKDWIQNL